MSRKTREEIRRAEERTRRTIEKDERKPKKRDNNPAHLRGLNVSPMPRSPAIRKAKIPVSDSVDAWSELLAQPFTAPSAGVYAPISNDVVPCPSTKVRNYGTKNVLVQNYTNGNATEGFAMHFFPSGSNAAGGETPLAAFTMAQSDIDPSAQKWRTFGPILEGIDPDIDNGLGAAVGTIQPVNGTNSIVYTAPGATSAAAPLTTLPWDSLSNPFNIPTKTSDVQFKLTAFAIRISYSGRLQDTEGYVDFYNPYAWTGTGSEPKEVSSLRRDPSHRRCYFSNKRTYTFVWHPNCESCTYAAINRSDLLRAPDVPARFIAVVGGVQEKDEFNVEYIAFQEYKGHPAVPTNTPSPVAHDVVHVANAIPELRGKMNAGATEGPTSTLSQHVAVSKMHEHNDVVGGASKTIAQTVAKHVKGPKTSVLGTIADIALPFLSLL